VVDTGVIRGGYKTFTEADGSKVFAKYTVTEFKLPEVNGTFEFTGGTGVRWCRSSCAHQISPRSGTVRPPKLY